MTHTVDVGPLTEADHHRTALMDAVRSGNPHKVVRAVQNAVHLPGNVNYAEVTISSPLAAALSGGDHTIIQTLLTAKADPNAVVGVWDIVPLRLGIIRALVEGGLNTNEPTGEERIIDTLLLRPRISENVTDVVGYLMDQGMDPSPASLYLYLAACVNTEIRFDHDVLEWMFDTQGAVQHVDNNPFTRGATSAHYAVQLPLVQARKTLRIMADNKWDVNRNKPGDSIDYLMIDETGCRDPFDMENINHPLLAYVAVRGAKDMLAMLLTEFGADPNIGGQHGMTSLHVVCACNTEPTMMVCMLLVAKADPNQTDDDGNTPLHYAMSGIAPSIDPPEPSAVAKLLIGAKADPEVSNAAGRTANSFLAQLASVDWGTYDGIFDVVV